MNHKLVHEILQFTELHIYYRVFIWIFNQLSFSVKKQARLMMQYSHLSWQYNLKVGTWQAQRLHGDYPLQFPLVTSISSSDWHLTHGFFSF
jgi:hypothetical protein